jgi:cysteine desulfurase
MGHGEFAASAIRVSLPWDAPVDAAERFLSAWRSLRRRAA